MLLTIAVGALAAVALLIAVLADLRISSLEARLEDEQLKAERYAGSRRSPR